MHSLMAPAIVLAGTGGLRRTRSILISASCMKHTLCQKVHGRTSITIASLLACVSLIHTQTSIILANIQAAQIKYPVRESKDVPPKLISTIIPAKGGKWRTMTSRMGGKEDEGADD